MSTSLSFYPWQEETARTWLASRDRFAHAWLIHGMAGIGKRQFALAGAASLLCEQPEDGLACGRCRACRWVQSGNHPDLRRIRPDLIAQEEGEGEAGDPSTDGAASKKSASAEIRIDQLRQLEPWFNTMTHRGGWRVALVYPAQALNPISANAILKILEEPPAHTVFLLVADAPDRLLPTIVSRCRRLPLATPPPQASLAWLAAEGVDNARDWLAAASQAPLRARTLAASQTQACPPWLEDLLRLCHTASRNPDIASLADALEKESTEVWIDHLQRIFADLLMAHYGLGLRYFPRLDASQALARQANPKALADMAAWLVRQRALAEHPLNTRLRVHAALQRAVLACRAVSN